MKLITVFTPTYNRAFCLHQVYESLCRQTSQNFIWLIVDDGSSDNTLGLVNDWLRDGRIDIQYIFKKNGGMHTGHNTAYENISTELNMCCDSDDFLPDNAIEVIEHKWNSIFDKEGVAGIVGLDIYKSREVVGKKFPNDIEYSTLSDIYLIHKSVGDKKLILRTDVVKKYPAYPTFKEERFVPLGILYLMIDQDYKLACINEPVCVVEYLEDGSTMNIFKQYKRHPRGFRYSRCIELKYAEGFGLITKKILHLISSTLYVGDFRFFNNNPYKILTSFLIPLGLIFHIYINFKSR